MFSALNAADPSHYFRFRFHGLLKGGNVSIHASICVCLHLLLHLWTMRTQDRPRQRPCFSKRVALVQRHPVSRLCLWTRCAPPGVSTAGTCSREPGVLGHKGQQAWTVAVLTGSNYQSQPRRVYNQARPNEEGTTSFLKAP